MSGAVAKGDLALRRSSRIRNASACQQQYDQSCSVSQQKQKPEPSPPGSRLKFRICRVRQTTAPRVLKQRYQWLLDMSCNDGAKSDSNDSESEVENSEISSVDDEEGDAKQRSYSLGRCVMYPDADVADSIVEELLLPASCDDLMIDVRHALLAAGVYEGLRCFLKPLRLSPFRFEDLCAAVSSNEHSNLLDEIHISLLRVLLRSDEAAGTVFASPETKDSAAIAIWCGMSDSLSWYETIRLYLASFPLSAALSAVVASLGQHSQYNGLGVDDRLTLLQSLVDLFLLTHSARDFMAAFGSEIVHEDQCRYCHKLVKQLFFLFCEFSIYCFLF